MASSGPGIQSRPTCLGGDHIALRYVEHDTCSAQIHFHRGYGIVWNDLIPVTRQSQESVYLIKADPSLGKTETSRSDNLDWSGLVPHLRGKRFDLQPVDLVAALLL